MSGLTARFTAIDGLTPKGVLRVPLVLPAILGDFEHDEEASFFEYETVADGEFSMPAAGDKTARKLRAVDMEVLTTEVEYPWLKSTRSMWAVRDEIYAVLRARRPFALVVTMEDIKSTKEPTMHTELIMNATLRSVRRSLRHGQPGQRYYALTLREWRDNALERRASSRRFPLKHKLTRIDTLESLSKKYYGTARHARHLGEASGMRRWGLSTRIWEHPKFKVGDQIKIPASPKRK